MAKTERLFILLDALRRRRRPVTAEVLAEETGVSVRTIYRDIQSLVALGVSVEGEGGVGYVLGAGFFLPPLAFDDSELEALVAGARWVEQLPDSGLAQAAANALAKIEASTPVPAQRQSAEVALFVYPNAPRPTDIEALGLIRQAIREQRKLSVTYPGETTETRRTIWPLAIAFYDRPMLAAWCELRGDYRTFAIDRILTLAVSTDRLPRSRAVLFKAYLAAVAGDAP